MTVDVGIEDKYICNILQQGWGQLLWSITITSSIISGQLQIQLQLL